MLTGRHPFDAPSEMEIVAAILQGAPDAIAELRPEASPELAALVERCLEKDPARRFESGTQLHAALALNDRPPRRFSHCGIRTPPDPTVT